MSEDFKLYLYVFIAAFLLLGVFIVTLSLLYSKKQIQHRKEKTLLQQQFSETLLESQLEIQEQTMQHISRELHDNLGQIASIIKIHLYTFPLNDREKAAEKLDETKELIKQLILDLKGLSINLSSNSIFEYGIDKSFRDEIDRINKTGQFKATYDGPDIMPPLDQNTSIIIYRMSQEILNNMIKHSQASQIKLKVTASENFITLDFSDNGIGYDLSASNNHGSGIKNLTERARLIKAILSIDSSPGNGSKISIKLPLQPAYAAAGEESQTRVDR